MFYACMALCILNWISFRQRHSPGSCDKKENLTLNKKLKKSPQKNCSFYSRNEFGFLMEEKYPFL